MNTGLVNDALAPTRLDPLGGDALAGAVDAILITGAAAAISAPAVYAFVSFSLSGAFGEGDPGTGLLLLVAYLAACTTAAAYSVRRWGTPSERIRRNAGLPAPAPAAAEDVPRAGSALRATAGLLDAVVIAALDGVVLPAVTVATFFIPFTTPLVLFPVATAAIALPVLCLNGRRPGAIFRSAGMTVCRLRRVATPGGDRTVRISELAAVRRVDTGPIAMAVAWLAVLASAPLALYFAISLGTVLLMALLFPGP